MIFWCALILGQQSDERVGGMEGWEVAQKYNLARKSHQGPIPHRKAKEASSYIAMAAVPGHGQPIGTLYRCHSLSHDITWSAKCPPEKQTRSHWIG